MAEPSTMDMILIEQQVANQAPSTGAAYALCIFLGLFSAHRFYLGRPGTAVLQILSYFVLIGFVWWVIDLFMIPTMIREKKNEIRSHYLAQGGFRPGADISSPGKGLSGLGIAGLIVLALVAVHVATDIYKANQSSAAPATTGAAAPPTSAVTQSQTRPAAGSIKPAGSRAGR